jgi:hypothetical protein
VRIGLSLLTQSGHNIWNNGIGQNVFHLACILESIPFVEKVILVNTGDQDGHPAGANQIGTRFDLVPIDQCADLIDVIFEVSGGLNVEWLSRFRARGGKAVGYVCGQPYHAMVEPTIFNKQSYYSDPNRCDEVWLLPKDRPFMPMLRSEYQCPVYEVPYLWAPVFLEESARELKQSHGFEFGYRPGSLDKAVPAIFEPNISPIKMGTIPFMICEAAYAEMPDQIEKVMYMNGHHMAAQRTFIHLVEQFRLYADGKLTIAARDFFAHVMAVTANMVVSHQFECTQNYLYLDALHGNYPLIHNSPLFADVGYYYPDNDIAAGVEQFRLALAEHDTNLEFHRARNALKFEEVSPLSRANRDAYARRLVSLMNSKAAKR